MCGKCENAFVYACVVSFSVGCRVCAGSAVLCCHWPGTTPHNHNRMFIRNSAPHPLRINTARGAIKIARMHKSMSSGPQHPIFFEVYYNNNKNKGWRSDEECCWLVEWVKMTSSGLNDRKGRWQWHQSGSWPNRVFTTPSVVSADTFGCFCACNKLILWQHVKKFWKIWGEKYYTFIFQGFSVEVLEEPFF